MKHVEAEYGEHNATPDDNSAALHRRRRAHRYTAK